MPSVRVGGRVCEGPLASVEGEEGVAKLEALLTKRGLTRAIISKLKTWDIIGGGGSPGIVRKDLLSWGWLIFWAVFRSEGEILCWIWLNESSK